MIDAHVHIFHGNTGEYTISLINDFAGLAKQRGITELFLLEHTHQFYEFAQVYEPVAAYNEYQKNWLARKMKASLEAYTSFIDSIRDHQFPVKIRFGLEACYIPGTAHLLSDKLKQYHWDFVAGSIHYIDGWGFDHKSEFWSGVEVNKAYRRYYEIMRAAIKSGLFGGVAHPDSIKCFGHYPDYDLIPTYELLAGELAGADMYAEQSGGLRLNYGFPELGLNANMIRAFKRNNVRILTASDAHKPEHAGMYIEELQEKIKRHIS